MQDEIRIPVSEVPEKCTDCDYIENYIEGHNGECIYADCHFLMFDIDITNFADTVGRPPFCPIKVQSKSVIKREAIQRGCSFDEAVYFILRRRR